MADLQMRILGEDAASAAFSSVGSASRAAAQIFLDFSKQSLRAYAESDRAQRQLAVVAKDLSGAFQSQAKAMAEARLVSDELVMGVQTMLLRYGQAPAAVEATTQAVLDYAAATGTDARTATEALTRGVEAGTGRFKGLGISIEATGDKTKDLAAATAELARKYGGSGAADAASLTGQVRGAEEAFGELQETFGGFIAAIASKTGALGEVTRQLRELTAAMEMASKLSVRGMLSQAGQGGVLSQTLGRIGLPGAAGLASFGDSLLAGNASTQASSNGEIAREVYAQKLEEALQRSAIANAKGGSGAKRVAGGAGAASRTTLEGEMLGPQTYAAWANSDVEGPAMPTGEQFSAMAKFAADQQKHAAEAAKKSLDELSRHTSETAKRLAAQSKEFAKAGADIGAAFTNSITSALEQLASGGEQDVGKILASILAGVLGTVGSVLGNLILPGLGGVLGGAAGGLLGAGVKAAANGPTVNINTFDSRSTREFFEADGGRGLTNAKRTGRGQGW